MASPETFQRFVSGSKGQDTPTGGRTATDKPLKTINAALSQLVAARSSAQQKVTINVDTGTYREHITLVDNVVITGTNQRKSNPGTFPSVRILRDLSGSIQGTSDASPPTSEDVISIRGNDVEVVGLFIDGDGRPQRGVSIVKSTNVTLAGCVIANCRAQVYHPKFKGTQSDPLRESPVRHGKGAGLIIKNSSKVLVTGCVFTENGNALTFRRRVFDSVKQRILNAVNPVVRLLIESRLEAESQKIEPVRDSGGGHVEMEQVDEVRFADSFFEKGFCTGRGGAVHAFKDAFFDMEACEFKENEAATDGGAVAINNEAYLKPKRKLITISNSTFEKNKAGDDGGGIYATSKTLLKLFNCSIQNNTANTNGGGVRISFGCEVNVEKCIIAFNENNVDAPSKNTDNRDGGGGIGVNNSSVTLDGCTIVSNTTHGFAGAGVYFITVGYNKDAEEGARLSHGETFENILKDPQKFNVTKCRLVIKNKTQILENRTPGDTFYGDKKARLKGGAGAGLYALESTATDDVPALGIPVEVVIENSSIGENKAEHRDDEQKAEMVFRGITSLRLSGETVLKHNDNKFLYSLFKVKNKDVATSTTFAAGLAAGTVLDK